MVASPIPVFLSAAPGPLREAVQALLLSLPQVAAIYPLSDPDGPEGSGKNTVVVLIAERTRPWSEAARQIRRRSPEARIAVLTDDPHPAGSDRSATTPADLILQQGDPPKALAAAFERFLVSIGEEGNP